MMTESIELRNKDGGIYIDRKWRWLATDSKEPLNWVNAGLHQGLCEKGHSFEAIVCIMFSEFVPMTIYVWHYVEQLHTESGGNVR